MSSSVQSCIKKNLNWLWAQFIFNLKYELHCHSDTLAIGPVPFLHCTTSSAKPQQNNKAPSVSRFSHSLMPDSFRPCGLQHTRPPCPSPTPRACSNSCPLSRWCHPAVSSSVVPSPPAFTLSQHQGLFQWVSSLHQVAKGLEFQFQHQSFQWIIRTDFLQDGLVWSPCSPRDSQESSPTPQFRSINSSTLFSLQSKSHIHTGALEKS